MTDTREKIYLKVLQSLSDALDPDDPQYEIQQKAVHTIAAEYIKNKIGGEILIEEFREFETQMVQMEEDLAVYARENEQLTAAREEDKQIKEDMIVSI